MVWFHDTMAMVTLLYGYKYCTLYIYMFALFYIYLYYTLFFLLYIDTMSTYWHHENILKIVKATYSILRHPNMARTSTTVIDP